MTTNGTLAPVRTCPRCGGVLHIDGYGEVACLICGWRDYRDAQARAMAEENARVADAAKWESDGFGSTRANRRASRRRNR